MAAYILVLRQRVTNPAEMKLYAEKAKAVDSSKVKALARFGRVENLEQAPFEGGLILEFPTFEDAQAWYYSPEYTEARQHRLKGAEYSLLLMDGV